MPGKRSTSVSHSAILGKSDSQSASAAEKQSERDGCEDATGSEHAVRREGQRPKTPRSPRWRPDSDHVHSPSHDTVADVLCVRECGSVRQTDYTRLYSHRDYGHGHGL